VVTRKAHGVEGAHSRHKQKKVLGTAPSNESREETKARQKCPHNQSLNPEDKKTSPSTNIRRGGEKIPNLRKRKKNNYGNRAEIAIRVEGEETQANGDSRISRNQSKRKMRV